MLLKLRIHAPLGDGGPTTEKSFGQDEISIGRGEENTLPLDSKHVSRFHVRIRRVMDEYEITDLRSTNATFVNDEPLIPDKAYPLSLGDKIRVGDHTLEVVGIEHRPPSLDPTPPKEVQQPPAPPHAPPPAGLSDSPATVEKIADDCVAELSRLGRTHIEQALRRAAGMHAPLGDTLAESAIAPQLRKEIAQLGEENARLRDAIQRLKDASQAEGLPVTASEHIPHDDRKMDLLRMFFHNASLLSSGRMSFLNEFVRDSMVWKDLILNDSEEDFARALLDPLLTEEKARVGKEKLKSELDELLAHTIGVVQGYRGSATVGVRSMLSQMDPLQIRQTQERPGKDEGGVPRQGVMRILERYVPLLADLRARRAAWKRLKELLHEERGVLEKRYFRQAFVQAYKESLRGME